MTVAPELFPIRDPVGPAEPGLQLPGRDVIADVVAAGAAAADIDGVQRSTLDALATVGLLGSPLAPALQREAGELIAGSDAATWFCWVQHQTPLRTLEEAPPSADAPGLEALREELLPGLRTGRLLAAVAFAHVRRPGPPNPVATRTPEGWRLDGTLDWVTSWDIADVALVMAQGAGDDAGSLVCCYLPAGRPSPAPRPGLHVGEPLRLLAMGGTHTRPVRLDAMPVPIDRVAAVLDRQAWLEVDGRRTTDANPSAFGLARASIAELDALAERRSDAAGADLVAALVEECREVRAAAYEASAVDDALDVRLRLRARSLDLATRAATAVVVMRAGAAMRTGEPAERRLREAMFLLVQAQTAATRAASIALLRQQVSE